MLEENFFQKNGKGSLAKIYRNPSKCKKLATWGAQPGQVAENCVRENFNVGTRIRFKAKLGDKFYLWFVDTESKLLNELFLPANDIVLNADPTLRK